MRKARTQRYKTKGKRFGDEEGALGGPSTGSETRVLPRLVGLVFLVELGHHGRSSARSDFVSNIRGLWYQRLLIDLQPRSNFLLAAAEFWGRTWTPWQLH